MTDVMAQNPKPRVITLMGPTASGKTDLAIALTQRLNAEIISVDSALVYQGMDIGSAKPTADELSKAPHRLIDILDPAQSYNAADFCKDAQWHIRDILAKGKTPLLVGGTMLYFKALLEGLSDMPATNAKVRAQIEQLAAEHGWPYVHAVLSKADPQTAQKIHPNHSQRISRALEVFRISGVPMSRWQKQTQLGLIDHFQWVQLAIAPKQRSLLHQRIARRFELMVEAGFLDEMRALMARHDLYIDTPAMRAVGYRQAWEYLDGQIDYATFLEKGIAATRQLAKRQLTWLRGWQDLNWVYTQNESGDLLSNHEIVIQALKVIEGKAI